MADLNAFEKNQDIRTVDASKKLRVGIVGTGGIAKSHISAYLKQPDVEIVAGCDLIPGRAQAFFASYGLEGVKTDYPDGVSMLKDVSLRLDCVSICTYNRQHAPCAIAALEAGINVLLEKPMCVTLDEAIDIIKAEKKSGKVLSIGFQPRFNPNMQKIKKIVDSGELGDVYYVQTGGGRRRGIPAGFHTTFIEDETAGVGALGDIGCYSIDLVMQALGHPRPLTVTGVAQTVFGKDPNCVCFRGHSEFAEKFGVDDWSAAFIRLEGGIVLDYRIGWAMNLDTPGDTLILGTKGGLRVPSTQCWNGVLDKPLILYKEVAGIQTETVIPLEPNNDLWYEKIRSFLDAVKEGKRAPVPSSEIFYNQAIIDGIVRSSELGREITLDLPAYEDI